VPPQDPRKIENIEKMEKNLYSRDFESKIPRAQLSEPETNAEKGWNYEHEFDKIAPPPVPTPHNSLFKKIFIGSIVFFVLSMAIAAYVFFFGTNIISADKVDVTFIGPVTVGAGDSLSVDIVATNKNNSVLMHPMLFVSYPDGTKKASDVTQIYP
jgi:hypothetical protein